MLGRPPDGLFAYGLLVRPAEPKSLRCQRATRERATADLIEFGEH